jgi:PAS domain S-box-containing protein
MDEIVCPGPHTESFLKAAQYIVRLTAEQNALEELGKIIVAYFHASWVAFAGMDTDGKIFLHDCAMFDKDLHGTVLMEKAAEHIHDVFSSGFLASATVVLSEPYAATFLPMTELNQTRAVMIVAHKPHEPVSAERLNLYLALAGIAGSTMGRISTEQELRRHQRHLEDLVEERTRSLRASNEKLEQEIADRARAEEVLKESEEKYNRFFRTSMDCIFITSKDGRWIDLNDAAVRLFGYASREELMPVNISALYARPEERETHARIIAERGYTEELPMRLLKKDGTVMDTIITSVALRDRQGNVVGFQGTIRDITARVAADKDRERLIDELRKAMANVKMLSGLLPVCAWCKKIRNDEGYWQQMELYIRDHSEADFTHGLCPDCAKKLRSELL